MRKSSIAAILIAAFAASSANAQPLATARLSDGRLQVFAIDQSGQIQSRWKTSVDPDASWTEWTRFQTPGGGVTDIAADSLPDGRVQIFVTQPNGRFFSSWKETPNPDAAWVPWQAF